MQKAAPSTEEGRADSPARYFGTRLSLDVVRRLMGGCPPDDIIGTTIEKNIRPYLDLVNDLRHLGIEKVGRSRLSLAWSSDARLRGDEPGAVGNQPSCGMPHPSVQDLPIPQIAVMGDQSSGKSSVLEAISGIGFPRGSGLVTRCATQINMTRGHAWACSIQVRPASGGAPKKAPSQIAEMSEVTTKIQELTKELTGGDDHAFSSDVIEIDLVSPTSPDLTVIDLPGIVRTTTDGQDVSVIKTVDALLNGYLEQARTVVLAVVPCNVDVATSDILERAHRVDSSGERTLGVLTKPDLIDPGAEAEAVAVLKNQRKPLTLGYVMVKNRSQKELSSGLQVSGARENEAAFFEGHPEFSELQRERPGLFGVQSLTQRLTTILVNRIKTALPEMLAEASTMLDGVQQQLGTVGPRAPTTAYEQRIAVYPIINEFQGRLRDVCIMGIGDDERGSLMCATEEFHAAFKTAVADTAPDFAGKENTIHLASDPESLEEDVPSVEKTISLSSLPDSNPGKPEWKCHTLVGTEVDMEDVTYTVVSVSTPFRDDIAERMRRSRGRELPGFLNFVTFVQIFKHYMLSWVGPGQVLLNAVQKETAARLTSIPNSFEAVRGFPRLKNMLHHEINRAVDECRAAADRCIREQLILAEEVPFTMSEALTRRIQTIQAERLRIVLARLPQNEEKLVPVAEVEKAVGEYFTTTSSIGNERGSSHSQVRS